jgi:hypothetical protein
LCFQWAGSGEVALLATLETVAFLSTLLFFGFGNSFAGDHARVHCVRVTWWETRTCSAGSGICVGPAPASAVCVAIAVVVPGLRWREDVVECLFAHPAAVLFLRCSLPFFEGVQGVNVDDRFSEHVW